MNEAQEIKITLSGVKDCSVITERLEAFIELLPDEESLKIINSSVFQDINNHDLLSYIVKKLYYCSVI